MKPWILLLTFYLVAGTQSRGQNSREFFKTIPVITEGTPEWAQLMYSENPDVGNVEDLFKAYYKTHEFKKSIHTQNHKHWIKMVEPLLDEDGFIRQPTKEEEDAKHLQLKEAYRQRNSISRLNGFDWRALGPFETFSSSTHEAISWHKNIYAIDQSISNPDILICGTEAGGIYKTTDKAANWILISKGETFSGGNSAVKIHPTNPEVFLVASNDRIYLSLDGGQSWEERHYTGGSGNEFEYAPADFNVVFHTSSSGLFKSVDGGFNWSRIYSENCWDIDFHPADNSTAYLLKSNGTANRAEIFRSDDGGNSWSLKDNGWYVPEDVVNAFIAGGKIAVTPASPDLVYACLIGASKVDDNGWIGVYKSVNRADSWTNPSGQDGGPYGDINGTADWNVAAYSDGYHQGFFNFDLEASPTNPDKIWVATIRLSESSDGGQTFQSIGAANSNRLSSIHADVQDLEVLGNDIWVATDGGVNYSNDGLMTHASLNRGIQAAHFWGFNTGWNEDTYTGGKYHDGTSGWAKSYGNGKAYNIGGVEEASGYVHPIESRKLMFRTHYASDNTSVRTIPDVFGNDIINHAALPVRPNESYSVAQRSGVYFDPRYADHIYVGLENKVYKSTDGGLSFDVLYTFPGSNGEIYEMEISRSNPDVIYGVYNPLGGYWDPCEIWKSMDGGASWSKTASNPDGNRRRFRISVHPEDENTVWICTPRGINGQKVHVTSNGGAEWQNRTTSALDDEEVTDILYQGGTDDIVYLTSRNGVFFWDKELSEWQDFSAGLPLITKSLQVNPFYRDAELRLGTTGRGVWGSKMQDTLFTPIAQPITYADVVNCPTDTIHFDCYSMLRHEGASWQWSISPAPQFISADDVRNPEVVFGAIGSYDVSLMVTDAQGNSSTKTIPGMVTVIDDCRPCLSYGNMSWATAVTLVEFESIQNPSGKTQPYTDYTEIDTAIVDPGSTHDLNVHLNTDGDYTIHASAWIDWNQDTDFNDAGEAYYLGDARDTPDGPSSRSPLAVSVPSDALPGETILRVSARFAAAADDCETGFDGEVEDYRLIVNRLYLTQETNIAICNGDSVLVHGDWQSATGYYYDTVRLTPSMDSVYLTVLTVNESSNNTMADETCDTYTSPSGLVFSESGIYNDTIPNAAGCDSVLTIVLEVVAIDTSVEVNVPVLTANAANSAYQWMDCESMQVLAGSTGQSFEPTVNGSYAVIVTDGDCSDTSSCYQVTSVHETINDFGSDLKVYPNPTNGNVVVELGVWYASVSAKISDVFGRLISRSEFRNTDQFKLKIRGSSGYYYIEIIAIDGKKATIKIVKE